MEKITRRKFLRETALGTGAILIAGLPSPGKDTPYKHVFKPRMVVNPVIDNLKVVCGINKSMIRQNPSSWEMNAQNSVIDATQVELTLDRMAIALTTKSSADEAWKTIFRKPQEKEWSGVKAALKVNCLGKNHPRVALVNKICIELNRLGVPFNNIFIYDGKSNAKPLYEPYVGNGLPAGVVVSDKNRSMGGTVKLAIPDPRAGMYKCTRAIADGTIDILVNIAVNKGADMEVGKTTLTLKNHAGTFDPMPIHMGGGLDYVLAFNKSNAFWGGNPVRQQLCIVDSLWGSAQGGTFNAPDTRVDRIVMGTFSGAVDYMTAKKIRQPVMNAQLGAVERFVNEFGYQESEMTGWEEVNV